MSNLLWTIGGVIMGWFLNWSTSAPRHRRMREKLERLEHDHQRSLEQLEEATQAHQGLEQDSKLLLRALHNAGVINIRWGPDGEPLGHITDVLADVILQMGGGSVHEFKPKPQGGKMTLEGEE